MQSDLKCYRCEGVLEKLPESVPKVAFFECLTCGWHFAKVPGKNLHDRWLSPLSIVLYSIIYAKDPSEHSESIADSISQREDADLIIREIDQEIAHPKQKVSEILN